MTLAPADSEQLAGGLRLVRAERARPAPAFSWRDASGRRHTPATLRGRVVWIDLWATWCVTCKAEFPWLQEIHERWSPKGLVVLAVCRNSEPEDFERAVRKDWIGFAAVDATAEARFAFPYGAFPTSVVLDRAGRVRAYWQGHRDPAAVEELLRRLLAEPAPLDPAAPAPPPPAIARDDPERDAGLLPGSERVLRASLEMERREIPAGGLFEATIVLDVDPGWHLTAGAEPGAIPLEVSLSEGPGVRTFHRILPAKESATVAGAEREVHTGRLEIPVWGLVEDDLPDGRLVDFTVVATVQACDDRRCLAPAEIEMSGDVRIGRGRRR